MARITKLFKLLDSIGADGAIFQNAENIFYLSGFTGEGTLIITRNHRFILTDSRYTLMAKLQSPDFEVLPHNTSISDSLSDVSSVAYEDADLSVSAFEKIKNALSEKTLVPLGEAMFTLRQYKDEKELAAISAAVRLADNAYAYALTRICPGMHEYEVAALLEGYMRREAGALPSFETIVASGPRSAMPHGTASDRILQKGDFLTLDFGCRLGGYCSDITRTVTIGPASARQKEIYNIVLYAQTLAENAAIRGVSCAALDKKARDSICNFGYGDYFGHALGHGVGLAIHEYPTLSSRSVHVLDIGSVFTVEPGIYLPDEGGVRVEDMLCVTEAGTVILTQSPKTLVEIL